MKVTWLGPDELRVGLGCMRLTDVDEDVALATVGAALAAGVTVFDTAHAYGRGDDDRGHGERLLAAALAAHGAGHVRIVTKGGMRRPRGGWEPDGRARAIAADCEASLAALGGRSIDLYLLHAPDPKVPFETSVRALKTLVDRGLVRRVGLANVNRRQLDEALTIAPIAAVEVALSPFDDDALRGGVLARCAEHGLTLLAHAPLGGPKRAGKLARDPLLAEVAARHAIAPAEAALAWALDLDPCVVVLPGARRPETARAAVRAAHVRLSESERTALRARFGGARRVTSTVDADADVVMVMGIMGAGKSDAVAGWVARGYERLNRDERGGTLKGLAQVLDRRLGEGARRLVLDNTYLTRAHRHDVLEIAARRGVPVRGVWLDTPPGDAQVNIVLRMLAATDGRLLTPDELRRAREPWALPPQAHFRALRELEPPSLDEGFASLDVVPFVRRARGTRAGRFIALEAATARMLGSDEPTLVFAWRPDEPTEAIAARVAALAGRPIVVGHCAHPAGPPRCWCRPPLPGLVLAFALAHDVDWTRSVVVGSGPAHRTLARTLGADYEDAGGNLS